MKLQLLRQIIFCRPVIFPRIFYSSKFAYSQASNYISSLKFNHIYQSSVHLQYHCLPDKTLYDIRKRRVRLFDWSNHRRFLCTSDHIFRENLIPFKKNLSPFEKLEWKFQLDEILKEKFLSHEEWSSLIEEKSRSVRCFSKDVFDTFFIQKCLKINNVNLAVSYFDCQPLREFNFSALSFYLLLLGRNINTVSSDLFQDVYKVLQEQHPLPDNINSNVIEALCMTNFWKLASHHIEHLENSKSKFYRDDNYNYFARALSENKSLKEGMNYLIGKKSSLKPKTITSVLYIIAQISNYNERNEQLMLFINYLHKFEASLNARNAKLLSNVGKASFDFKEQKINNGEQCHSCGSSLNLVPLDKEMVSVLKDAFEESAVKGKDIYQNTTPQEWSNFKKFLAFEGSFDVVIDGLNFYYNNSTENSSKPAYRRKDSDILDFYGFVTDHYEKILIISRMHTKAIFERLRYQSKRFSKIKFYYLNNQTKDDVFILYAALYSGFGCQMITRDYMRNYKFVIHKRSHLEKQFLYWQSLHQCIIPHSSQSFDFFQPYQYHRVPQYNHVTKSWHFPVESGEEYDYFVPEDKWLCLRELAVDGVDLKNDDNDVTPDEANETKNVRANKLENKEENVKKEKENNLDPWNKILDNLTVRDAFKKE